MKTIKFNKLKLIKINLKFYKIRILLTIYAL